MTNFGTNFLIPKAKKAFTHLQKTFIKAQILHHIDLKHHIHIEIDALRYGIGRVLSQMTLDQPFFNHIIHKNLEPNFKSEIGQ